MIDSSLVGTWPKLVSLSPLHMTRAPLVYARYQHSRAEKKKVKRDILSERHILFMPPASDDAEAFSEQESQRGGMGFLLVGR